MHDEEVSYILDTIAFVADHGWRFLPDYKFNHKTGEWKHTTRFTKFSERKWISNVDFGATGTRTNTTTICSTPMSVAFESTFAEAKQLAASQAAKTQKQLERTIQLEASVEALRWFVYPSEAAAALQTSGEMIVDQTEYELKGPMNPRVYDGTGSPWDTEPDIQESRAQIDDSSNPNVSSTQVSERPPPDTKHPSRCNINIQPEATFLQPAAVAAINATADAAQKAVLRPKITQKLKRAVGQAMQDWRMVAEGDKLLLGLSGGKDSLTLLHVLMDLQKRSPVKFELACATVDPQTPSFDPSPLIEYCKSLGVRYFYLQEPIVEQAKTRMEGDSLCAFCSRMKRGLLYSCCRQPQSRISVRLQPHLVVTGAKGTTSSCWHNTSTTWWRAFSCRATMGKPGR